jgi:RNA-binding protein YlmH
MSLTKTSSTAVSAILLEALNGKDSLIQADEFDVAVKSLRCDALHNNVDGFVRALVNDTGVTAKESHDFCACYAVWDL